jgi:hypothetical protein
VHSDQRFQDSAPSGIVDALTSIDAVVDSPLPTPICAVNETVSAFAFDFDDGTARGLETYADSPARINFADGMVKIAPGTANGNIYAGAYLTAAADLRSHRTRLQIVQMTAIDKPVLALFAVSSATDSK